MSYDAGEHTTVAQALEERGFRLTHNPVTEFVRNSPFLALSLVIHLVVLGLLAFLTAQEPAARPKRITIQVEDIQQEEMELQPLRREENLSSAATGGAIAGAGGVEGESYDSAATGTAEATMDRVNILGLKSAVGGGGSGQFEGKGGDGFDLAGGTGEKSVQGAVDQFAVVTINSVARGKTLVVLMIDRSRSVIYGDLPRLIQRMDHYFDEIDRNLVAGLGDNGRWIVVSFGREPTFKCEPSADLDYVKAALQDVEVDVSGEENVGQAINTVLDRYGDAGYRTLLIAAMTDESGDDIKDPVLLERTIKRMRQKKAHFFVFGYESTFCAQLKRIQMKLDPELMRGSDRDAIRGFEGQTIWGWAFGGPEAPRPELWWGQNWHTWAHWGGHLNDLPSGFGMYGLNRMVLATGGIYFLLKPESHYDEEKLYAKYKPDICSVFTYKERMKSVALRDELNAIWHELSRFYLPYDLRNNKQIQQQLDASRVGRDYCVARAVRLKKILENSQMVGDNWTRWEAHGELTLAELVRLRFMLGQYHEVLKRTWEQNRRVVPPKKRYIVTRGKVPTDYVGGAHAKAEYDLALEYIELVIAKHKDTPWEKAALRMKQHLFPWQCRVVDIPKPSGQPSPPGLAF